MGLFQLFSFSNDHLDRRPFEYPFSNPKYRSLCENLHTNSESLASFTRMRMRERETHEHKNRYNKLKTYLETLETIQLV